MRFNKPFAALFSLSMAFIIAGTAIAAPAYDHQSLGSLLLSRHSAGLSENKWSSLSNVTVTGRVKTAEGRPIKGATLMIRDAETNAVIRTALSSPFGYYRLDQIETGHLYVLSVSHKRYIFALPAHLLEINEDRTGVDFTGEVNE